MFETFTKKLQKFGVQALKKTGEVTEIATRRTKVLSKKKNIQDTYTALGKAYYAKYKNSSVEFAGEIQKIDQLLAEIAVLEEEIKELKAKLPKEAQALAVAEDESSVVEETAFVVEDAPVIAEETAPAAEEAASDTEEIFEEE